MQPKVTYIGYPGHGNLGDDALYQANQKIFRDYQLIPDNREQHSKITLFGGGTILPHFACLAVPNRYNYAYGVGVRSPIFWGKFDLNFHPSLMVSRMKKFNFRLLGVRDETSKYLLRSMGIDSKVIGDACLILEPTNYKKTDETKIAINVGSDGIIWGKSEERVIIEIAKLCTALRKEGYYPILVPFWWKNLSSIEKIAQNTNTPVFEHWRNAQSVLDFISSCFMLIGEKLHSIVFSSAAHVPFISLEYRPKCYNFAKLMDFQEYCIRTDKVTRRKLMVMIHNLSGNWSEKRNQLIERVEKCRKVLRDFAEEIEKDIDTLPDSKWTVNTSQEINCFIHTHILKTYLFIKQSEKQKRARESYLQGLS